MIKTVRELSSKGWSSNEISKKLLIDEHAITAYNQYEFNLD